MKEAQIKDSIATIQYIYWLKNNVGKQKITEQDAIKKLNDLRSKQGNFINPSFAPICGAGSHGALPHYESSPETNVVLEEGTFLVNDTGGGYYEGSTDITRTIALGTVTEAMKENYTNVLKGHLQLGNAVFLHGVNGVNLDILARLPLWKKGKNYNHGTGHGMGYLLNIHEAPSGIRWQYRPSDSAPFEEGMIVTNEPGYYVEGDYGIRLENNLIVRNGEKNEYGQFMYFEDITYVPFEREAIIPELLTNEEKKWLNDYHHEVYKKISPFLEEEVSDWLKEATKKI